MKSLLFSLLFSALLIFGCSDNPLMSPSPETESLQQSPNQQKLILLPTSSDPSILNNPEVIDEAIKFGINNIWLEFSIFIDGEIGGEFIIDTTYFNSEGRLIEVYARLKFDPGAFAGIRRITIIPNPEDLSIQLFPHITFNNTVKLDYFITGLDLEAFGYTSNSHVDFIYFSDNGDIELVQNNGSNVHFDQQWIRLCAGKLNHFSRYGWSR